ncbi:MAG: hypothetical protein ACXVHB_26795, partial [Solirubrobacteraceae bacterium]
AARLAGSSDTRSAMQEMKRLREQFKAAGHAGRDERDLRDQFERHATALFERSKREREQSKTDWLRRQQEALSRKKQFESDLQRRIYDAERRLNEMMIKPSVSMRNPRWYEISNKREAAKSRQRQRITELNARLADVRRQIYEIDSRMRSSY